VASDLLSKWLAWWQPLRGGLTLWGLANGLPLTNGWFWARVRGGYLLYRGCGSRDQIDWSRPAGAAAVDATVIREYGWMRQDQPGEHWYGVRAVSGAGLESEPSFDAAGCGVGDDGCLIGALPGDVERAWAEPAAAGRVLLRWLYAATYEGAPPSEFRIYHDSGTGQIDYAQPAATVAWDLRRRVYRWLSGTYFHGTRNRFVVRAANAAGEGGGAQAAAVVPGPLQARAAFMIVEVTHGS